MVEFSRFMQHALELARRGEGEVEPNPMVGCVLVQQETIVGEGWHQRFGGLHAEVEAINQAGAKSRGATLLVTLEPCCHQGKTPPCTDAILAAGISRVIVAQPDPFPQVAGSGIEQLRQAGLSVEVGLLRENAQQLNAPYRKLLSQAQPWVIAKWAMTLDGKIASVTGDSKWISNEASRQVAHRLRGIVDAILIGSRTAQLDDPLLTARPAGPRTATRVVFDSSGKLPSTSQLVRTARQTPTIIVVRDCAENDQRRLTDAGCEVLVMQVESHEEQLMALLTELGRRQFTNVLIEGGGALLGAAFDSESIDEVHVFVAPKLLGGGKAAVPIAGDGSETIAEARSLASLACEELNGNVYLHGRLAKEDATEREVR